LKAKHLQTLSCKALYGFKLSKVQQVVVQHDALNINPNIVRQWLVLLAV
jgi:hypothetical protein